MTTEQQQILTVGMSITCLNRKVSQPKVFLLTYF